VRRRRIVPAYECGSGAETWDQSDYLEPQEVVKYMYIGVGTIVLILVIIVIVMLLRRG
jgi:hypothetical protein